jgi:hypothetical protein
MFLFRDPKVESQSKEDGIVEPVEDTASAPLDDVKDESDVSDEEKRSRHQRLFDADDKSIKCRN